jgi:hypothetical protein
MTPENGEGPGADQSAEASDASHPATSSKHHQHSEKQSRAQRRTGSEPVSPRWRKGPNSATSREGAIHATTRAEPLKVAILRRLAAGPASPEELLAKFAADGERVLLNTIRARCSDLHSEGRLQPSGTFGRGESGKVRVIRWRLSTAEELSLFLARKAADDEHGEASHG